MYGVKCDILLKDNASYAEVRVSLTNGRTVQENGSRAV
jgi:hypothetical protein